MATSLLNASPTGGLITSSSGTPVVSAVATVDNTTKANLTDLLGNIHQFVTKCSKLNQSYLQKHYELLRVFFAFNALHVRYDNLRRMILENLTRLQQVVHTADQSSLRKDLLKQLMDEQRKIATDSIGYDFKMLKVSKEYSEMLGDETGQFSGRDTIISVLLRQHNLIDAKGKVQDFADVAIDKLDTVLQPDTSIKGEEKEVTIFKKEFEKATDAGSGADANDLYYYLKSNTAVAERVVEQLLLMDYVTSIQLRPNVVKNQDKIFALVSHQLRPVIRFDTASILSFTITKTVDGITSASPGSAITSSRLTENRLCFVIKVQPGKKLLSEIRQILLQKYKDQDTTYQYFKKINHVKAPSGGEEMLIMEIPLKYVLYPPASGSEYTAYPTESRMQFTLKTMKESLERLKGDTGDLQLALGLYQFSNSSKDSGNLFLLNDVKMLYIDYKADGKLEGVSPIVKSEDILTTTETMASALYGMLDSNLHDIAIKDAVGKLTIEVKRELLYSHFCVYVVFVYGTVITGTSQDDLASYLDTNIAAPDTDTIRTKIQKDGNLITKPKLVDLEQFFAGLLRDFKNGKKSETEVMDLMNQIQFA